MRLIDANRIPYHTSGLPKGDGFDSRLDWTFREDIDKLPTVDAVEVVRCKDCDWHSESDGVCTNPKCGKSWYGCPVPDEHYCSYGEWRRA